MSKSGFSKFLVGTAIGIGIGLLVAKKTGKETRSDLKNKFSELEEKMKSLEPGDLKEGAIRKFREVKQKLSTLEKEDVEAIASEKLDDIKQSLSDLAKLVKKKSAPMIRKLTDELSMIIDDIKVKE